MLHLHFGTGRLGLGLVVPAFRSDATQTVLLNRAVSGANATGGTALGAARRNALLAGQPDRTYRLRMVDASGERDETIPYAGFHTYESDDVRPIVREIALGSVAKRRGVMVTASVLKVENYGPVVEALNTLSQMKEAGEPIGPIFLVACENTVSAEEVLHGPAFAAAVMPSTLRQVAPVAALVDRMCVELEEDTDGPHPMVRVHTEPYASLKLELTPGTEILQTLCGTSGISFSRHLDVEKQIKGWLLNGCHWLIALEAFQVSRGDRGMKLNEFIGASPEHRRHAIAVMDEMREGVALLLRGDPDYAAFVAEVDVDEYLAGAATAILRRFFSTEDPITRILARFQAPKHGDTAPIEAFSRRFADRINGPIGAYEAEKGVVPPATGRGLLSLLRLVESGTFIDAGGAADHHAR
ncbi:hypothetical protein [Methylobacterium sp.]|uniref:hypothetical protein n=1 Tax=Methylobacterium sp. TaxID=409 RepID=UPI0026336852|nr:hypothetical protein [Methylobacterium sp.]MDB5647362.1 hypothetical protein [Methylobacterium sp.]